MYHKARANTQIGSLLIQKEERLFLSTARASREVRLPSILTSSYSRTKSNCPHSRRSSPTPPSSTRLAAHPFISPTTASRASSVGLHARRQPVRGSVLKQIFALPNLRRAPGFSGTVKRFRFNVNGTEYYQYFDENMDPSPWRTSLILQVSFVVLSLGVIVCD